MELYALFLAASLKYNLPAGLLESLCYVESKHEVWAVHLDDGGSDSIGVCQIKWETARSLHYKATPRDLFNPALNIDVAANYLSHQIKRYGKINKGVIAYNLGHAADLTSTKYQVRVFKQWQEWKDSNE